MLQRTTRCAVAAILLCSSGMVAAQSAKEMTFFVTSTGLGKGGDLGGLEGADKHCLALATAAGAGQRTWRAYLSASKAPGVNARDRIGKGPWRNAKGVEIASDIAVLHGANKIDGETALDERGVTVDAKRHDMLTGSREAGRFYPADRGDRTCSDWTGSGEGTATVGHHDRKGSDADTDPKSWVTAHRTKGCSQAALAESGGAGLFYCFAAD
jgi:hypothetical protein